MLLNEPTEYELLTDPRADVDLRETRAAGGSRTDTVTGTRTDGGVEAPADSRAETRTETRPETRTTAKNRTKKRGKSSAPARRPAPDTAQRRPGSPPTADAAQSPHGSQPPQSAPTPLSAAPRPATPQTAAAAQWPDLLLRHPLPPAPVTGVLALLAPVLDQPLLVVPDPPLPPVPDLTTVHRAELEAEFTTPPATDPGDLPAIPARFDAGLRVLPHIEFPP